MPELGGRELAEQLTRLRPRTKVLFTSGYLDTAVDDKFADQQALILQKPFALNILASRIREVLDQPATIRKSLQ